MFIKYGTKIKILNGLFEGCKGIFFQNKKDNKGLVEVFFILFCKNILYYYNFIFLDSNLFSQPFLYI